MENMSAASTTHRRRAKRRAMTRKGLGNSERHEIARAMRLGASGPTLRGPTQAPKASPSGGRLLARPFAGAKHSRPTLDPRTTPRPRLPGCLHGPMLLGDDLGHSTATPGGVFGASTGHGRTSSSSPKL